MVCISFKSKVKSIWKITIEKFHLMSFYIYMRFVYTTNIYYAVNFILNVEETFIYTKLCFLWY